MHLRLPSHCAVKDSSARRDIAVGPERSPMSGGGRCCAKHMQFWKDGPYTGGGAISTPSGVLNNCKYNFGSLTGLSACTSPAEMLAAAIASSMSRMVAVEMAKAGIRPLQVETDAALTWTSWARCCELLGHN